MSVLTPTQYTAAQVATVLGSAAAIALNSLPITSGTGLAVLAAGAAAVSADAATSFLRHGSDTRFLGWLDGSGGLGRLGRWIGGRVGNLIERLGLRALHIPVVGAGLALTFGGAVDPVINAVKQMVADPGFAPTLDLGARLFIGIEPMAFVEASAAPKGQKLRTFVRASLQNLGGSAVGTLVLPAWDGLVNLTTHVNPWIEQAAGLAKGIAVYIHYAVGYSVVLGCPNYNDNSGSPQVQAEIAEGRRGAV